jgi:hypothetical protein
VSDFGYRVSGFGFRVQAKPSRLCTRRCWLRPLQSASPVAPTPYNLRPTPYTLYPTLCTLRPAHQTPAHQTLHTKP